MMVMILFFTEVEVNHANCCIVTAAGTTSWTDQMFEVPAAGLVILKHIHARHQTRRRLVTTVAVIIMVMVMVIIVAVMVMILFFTEVEVNHANCCIVTAAGTTSWTDQMFKVPAAGLVILKHIHARHRTRRRLVTTVAV